MVTAISDAVWDKAQRVTWAAAVKWGFGTVALTAVSVVLWLAFDKQSEFIRGQLLENNKAQATVITQNSELLKQNTEAMRSSQTVIEQCTRSNGEVCKILERVITKLERRVSD